MRFLTFTLSLLLTGSALGATIQYPVNGATAPVKVQQSSTPGVTGVCLVRDNTDPLDLDMRFSCLSATPGEVVTIPVSIPSMGILVLFHAYAITSDGFISPPSTDQGVIVGILPATLLEP